MLRDNEIKNLVDNVIIPAMKEKPYKTQNLLTDAWERNKVGGKLTANYLWSNMSLHDRAVIKAKATKEQEKWKKEHKNWDKPAKSMHHEGKEEILVDNKVAEILKKLGLGVPEHMKETNKAVIVDARLGELIKALHLGKDEKMTEVHHG